MWIASGFVLFLALKAGVNWLVDAAGYLNPELDKSCLIEAKRKAAQIALAICTAMAFFMAALLAIQLYSLGCI